MTKRKRSISTAATVLPIYWNYAEPEDHMLQKLWDDGWGDALCQPRSQRVCRQIMRHDMEHQPNPRPMRVVKLV